MPDQKEKPNGLAILIGIVTILVSIGLGVGGLLLVVIVAEGGTPAGIVLVFVLIVSAFYGLFSGARLAFVGGSSGKVFASVFWVLLIGGAICGCGLFLLLLSQ